MTIQEMTEEEIQEIPDSHEDLVERPVVMSLATTLADSTPQVTPIWFHYDGRHFYFNSARGRLKDRAIRRNPYVALTIMDPGNPYRFVAVRGPVVAIAEDGAREHIDFLAKWYRGLDEYPGPKDEQRVIYKVAPEHVLAAG